MKAAREGAGTGRPPGSLLTRAPKSARSTRQNTSFFPPATLRFPIEGNGVVSLVRQSKIEDIKVEQEREAEKTIRLHFQMEQIIYCQDQVYRSSLQKVRENETEEENKKKKSSSLYPLQVSSESSLLEILQHLTAYRQEATNRLSTHIPLIIQFFILKSYGNQLQKAMLQLLQDKEQYSWLLKERSDSSDKRKFLKERHQRLTQAQRRLAKFPG